MNYQTLNCLSIITFIFLLCLPDCDPLTQCVQCAHNKTRNKISYEKLFFLLHILFTRWTNYKFSTFIANTNIWIAHCLEPGVFLHLSLQFTVPKCVAKLECLASSIGNRLNTKTHKICLSHFFHGRHVSFVFWLKWHDFLHMYIFVLPVGEAEFRLISWCAHSGRIHQTANMYVLCIELCTTMSIFCVAIFWALFYTVCQKLATCDTNLKI